MRFRFDRKAKPSQEPEDEAPTIDGEFTEERADPNAGRYANGWDQAFRPTDEQRRLVKHLAGLGVTQHDIARILGIGVNTLRKHMMPEILDGAAEANAVVAGKLFQHIQAGNFAAIQFWMRVKMGWIEPKQGDTTSGTDLEKMTDDELRRELDALQGRSEAATTSRAVSPRMSQ